jgi:hypothetical protein
MLEGRKDFTPLIKLNFSRHVISLPESVKPFKRFAQQLWPS